MTGPRTVSRRAPGKLFIAGEYAVLEPGHPAILVAVDREVTATVSTGGDTDAVVESDLCIGPTRLRRHDGGFVGIDDGDRSRVQHDLSHVVSAIEVVDALLTERGQSLPAVHVSISSRLHRDGVKFGLGSSGAVTVATVTAVAACAGMDLSPDERFRLSMLATGAGSSGGDLAASAWGGWIAYQAPDRAAVRDMALRDGIGRAMCAPWPGFAVRMLPPPRDLTLEVGWTGQPAKTSVLAGRLRSRGLPQPSFLARSDERVRAAIHALDHGDDDALLSEVRGARQVLADLDDDFGLGIFTAKLTALCAAAEAIGAAAKPSGAGGGDCGIALLDAAAATDVVRLREQWAEAGVLPLPIRVQPTKGSEA
ncbi:phosphomevalonate kinase [Asanoa ferruginea]|uniref:phosphomevalonate kinase n=1 Tax=Asanoa ferruginea TaxID=53367 RepID=A0A3E0A3V4_9ACTN|nr:phosphomevalonate kinase [Asanoa ferruginea]REG01001.1 phosphomevalonate kinase [Asanoa ferruginea]GIF47601.1 phosphomevalonate kinase [Asanoa ferruginea]